MKQVETQNADERAPQKGADAGFVAVEIAAEIAAGAAVGAVVGVVAGPPGAAIGAVIGGAVGAAAGAVLKIDEHNKRVHDEEIDREIGVFGGNLGEAKPGQPPPKNGLYHAGSLGISSSSPDSSEGIIQNVDAD